MSPALPRHITITPRRPATFDALRRAIGWVSARVNATPEARLKRQIANNPLAVICDL